MIKGIWIKVYEEVGNMFPGLVTGFCLLAFAVPLVILAFVADDTSVKYWVTGSFNILWLLVFPALYVLVHIIHYYTQNPSRVLTILAVIGTGGFLLIVSYIFAVNANTMWIKLAATDCDTFTMKRDMQTAWEAADNLYNECIANQSAAMGESVVYLEAVMTVEDCPTYSTKLLNYAEWDYLKEMETTLSCGGWCTTEDPLWVLGKTEDSCSSVVAVILRYKAEHSFFQISVYSLVVVVFAAFALLAMAPVFHQVGVKW